MTRWSVGLAGGSGCGEGSVMVSGVTVTTASGCVWTQASTDAAMWSQQRQNSRAEPVGCSTATIAVDGDGQSPPSGRVVPHSGSGRVGVGFDIDPRLSWKELRVKAPVGWLRHLPGPFGDRPGFGGSIVIIVGMFREGE